MTAQGTILVADDDETFLLATADLLRQHGFAVDTAADATTAMAAVRSGSYDLLVSDLEMPGNEGLRLVREVAAEVGGLPVVILTGLPSIDSAIASIDLPVAAYLLKPVNMPDLLARIRTAITRFRAYRTMRDTESRMEQWRQELGQFTSGGPAPVREGAPSVDAFLALTLRNVMGSLSDLGLLGQALSGQRVDAHPCQLMNCPRGAQLQVAVRETIAVLEETKASFKSKRLGDLRQQLELLLEHV
ncbi:MAG TPA: response regulator [Gemmatimonadales bacterium]|jgi:CheY-like chemotaxis protein|nr:response regulator [Gemmatimonadales bacterium]